MSLSLAEEKIAKYLKEDAKADMIQKYSVDEARNLKSYGNFPKSIKIGADGDAVLNDDHIEFTSDDCRRI